MPESNQSELTKQVDELIRLTAGKESVCDPKKTRSVTTLSSKASLNGQGQFVEKLVIDYFPSHFIVILVEDYKNLHDATTQTRPIGKFIIRSTDREAFKKIQNSFFALDDSLNDAQAKKLVDCISNAS